MNMMNLTRLVLEGFGLFSDWTIRTTECCACPCYQPSIVRCRYNGEAFDEAKFFGWFDVHGSCGTGPDGALDLKEFGWYVADV